MKLQSENGIGRRRFLGTSGLTLLAASVSGIVCNVPSKDEDKEITESFQADGWKSIMEDAKKYRNNR